MKHTLIAAILLGIHFTPSHKVTITQATVDCHGYTSVIFVQDGKEWGLDYLTRQELDSLKAIK